MKNEDPLNVEERKLMDLIIDVWNKYNELPVQHPNEKMEFCTAIHQLQHLIGIRALRTHFPKYFAIKK